MIIGTIMAVFMLVVARHYNIKFASFHHVEIFRMIGHSLLSKMLRLLKKGFE